MSTKTIVIIVAGFLGGALAIGFGMMYGAGWETPGTYAGVSDASHTGNSTDCYSFQRGCPNSNTNIPSDQMTNGQYLNGNFNFSNSK